MKNLFFLFCFLIATVSFSQTSVNEGMKTYLNANGTVNYYSNVVDRMFDFLKKEYEAQNVPESVWNELSIVKEEALIEITELIIQSYEGHFSQDEMKTMLAFYDTDAGKKVLFKEDLGPEDVNQRDAFYASALGQKIASSSESLNGILQKLTQEWSGQLFKDVKHKLEEKGYIKG